MANVREPTTHVAPSARFHLKMVMLSVQGIVLFMAMAIVTGFVGIRCSGDKHQIATRFFAYEIGGFTALCVYLSIALGAVGMIGLLLIGILGNHQEMHDAIMSATPRQRWMYLAAIMLDILILGVSMYVHWRLFLPDESGLR